MSKYNRYFMEFCETGNLEKVKEYISVIDVHAHDDEALCRAVISGNLELVRFLVEECNCDPHTLSEYPIRMAVLFGHFHIVDYLINNHNCNIHACNDWVLVNVAKSGDLEKVQKLICQYNCDPSINSEEILLEATRGGHLHIIKYFTEVHNCVLPTTNNQPIVEAAAREQLNLLKYFLKKYKQRINVIGEDLLHTAIFYGRIKTVKYLIEKAGLNSKNYINIAIKGALPLQNKKIIKYLISNYEYDSSYAKAIIEVYTKNTPTTNNLEILKAVLLKHDKLDFNKKSFSLKKIKNIIRLCNTEDEKIKVLRYFVNDDRVKVKQYVESTIEKCSKYILAQIPYRIEI